MPTTPNYNFPYPNLSDAPNGPAALEDLAEAADTALAAVELAAIPKTLVNAKGDLIAATGSDAVARLPVGTNGQSLVADSGESVGLKWVSLSPAASEVVVATLEGTASATYTDLATGGPAVTLTVGPIGIAIVSFRAWVVTGSSANQGRMSFAVSGANTVAAADANSIYLPGAQSLQFGTSVVLSGLTPGSTTFTAKYRSAGSGSPTWADRAIGVVTF